MRIKVVVACLILYFVPISLRAASWDCDLSGMMWSSQFPKSNMEQLRKCAMELREENEKLKSDIDIIHMQISRMDMEIDALRRKKAPTPRSE